MSYKPEVIRVMLLDAQVCVPTTWSDDQATAFVNAENPTGISSRWVMKKNGDKWLGNDPERNPCDEREGFVHICFSC